MTAGNLSARSRSSKRAKRGVSQTAGTGNNEAVTEGDHDPGGG